MHCSRETLGPSAKTTRHLMCKCIKFTKCSATMNQYICISPHGKLSDTSLEGTFNPSTVPGTNVPRNHTKQSVKRPFVHCLYCSGTQQCTTALHTKLHRWKAHSFSAIWMSQPCRMQQKKLNFLSSVWGCCCWILKHLGASSWY